MRKRRLPHLVAEVDGSVAGYAYAVPFRKRPAYRYTLKHSIYVHHAFVNCGIGQTLLPALMDACASAGYRQLIGYIDTANKAPLRLHEAFGFVRVGLLPAVGFKFGQWVDSVLVQRALGPGETTLPGTLDANAIGHRRSRLGRRFKHSSTRGAAIPTSTNPPSREWLDRGPTIRRGQRVEPGVTQRSVATVVAREGGRHHAGGRVQEQPACDEVVPIEIEHVVKSACNRVE